MTKKNDFNIIKTVKRIWLVFCLILLVFCTGTIISCKNFCVAYAQPQQVKIIYNQTNVYNVSNFLELTKQQRDNCIIKIAKINEIFQVLEEQENIYKIQVEQQEGYILKSAAADVNLTSPLKKLNYNAVIIKDCFIQESTSDGFVPTDKKILNGTQVCLVDGYNQHDECTLVSYYQGNNLVYVYVETEMLKVDGVNANIFIYLSVIIAIVTIVVILVKLVIGKRKKMTN